MKRIGAAFKGVWAMGCRWSLVGAVGVGVFAFARLGVAYPTLCGITLAFAAFKRWRKWHGSGWIYGTARISSYLDVFNAGLIRNDGLVLGRATFTARPSRWQALMGLLNPATSSMKAMRLFMAAFSRSGGNNLIRIKDYVHVAVFAATGAGKGRGFVIPILRSYKGNIVTIDPKGENVKLSAAHREKMRHRIICLDPFHISGRVSDALNPCDMIDDKADDFQEQVDELVDSLIIVSDDEPQKHFPESAKIFLRCLIAFVCAVEDRESGDRNLQTVRHILKSFNRINNAINAMQLVDTHGGLIAGYGHTMTQYKDKELNGILTTLTRFTSWLDSAAMQAITQTSTFDPKDIKNPKKKLSVYLILPPNRLKTLASLNRMWISTLFRAQTAVADERTEVLYLLDEAAQLGRMQILEDAVAIMRGYGIRLVFFFQSIGQVSQIYGKNASVFLDNIGDQIFFGVNAFESADAIQKRSGDATVLMTSLNENTSSSYPIGGGSRDNKGSVSTSRGVTTNEVARPLFQAAEVLRLSSEVALFYHKNMHVIPIKLLKWYEEPEFKKSRCGDSGSGVGIRAGFLAALAMICSLGLLVASLPFSVASGWRSPLEESDPVFLFLREGEAPTEATRRRYAPPPVRPARPVYVPPPFPRGSVDRTGKRRGLNRPEQFR